MRPRSALAAAALSALSFGSLALAPSATAKGAPLDIYDAGGAAQGVVTTFAVQPSIFDPLLQAGALYAADTFNAQGGGSSHATASQLFPGTFAIGAVGCGGLPGGQWVQAFYPPVGVCTTEQATTLYRQQRSTYGADRGRPELDAAANTVLDRTDVGTGSLRTQALLGSADASVVVADYALRGDLASAPVVAARRLRASSGGRRTDALVSHGVQVSAEDVSLLGGLITIDSIVSTATTSSDGVTGQARGDLTFSGVRVAIGDKTYRAHIDYTGIHVDGAGLSHRARLGLDEELREALLQAGIRVTAGTPTQIVEGAGAEASVGGLVVAVTGRIPSVAVPSQLTPVLGAVFNKIPTKCLTEFEPPQAPQVGLCFGHGVVPSLGSRVTLTLSIATAASFTQAAAGPVFDSGGGTLQDGAGGTGTFVLGENFSRDLGTAQSTGSTTVGSDGAIAVPSRTGSTQPVAAFGRVARLPSAALAIPGVLFLVLAVGLALGPSLRHAGAR